MWKTRKMLPIAGVIVLLLGAWGGGGEGQDTAGDGAAGATVRRCATTSSFRPMRSRRARSSS